MKKALLTNRIYMNCDYDLREKINQELTYVIPSYNPNDIPIVIKNMGIINNNIISMPIGRVDLIPDNYEIVDKRILVPTEFPNYLGTLRESQQNVHDIVDDNCIINAWVSWGKTYTGLAIAKKLQQKTLVVTHTVSLRNQWVKKVRYLFGEEPGIIGSGSFDLSKFISIGNIQTLYRNISKIQKEFGTIILDEMHHVSAKTFSKLIDTSHARYKIGLSGTIRRKDGKHVVFRDYFGNHVITPPKENYMVPEIDIVKSDIRFMDGASTPWAVRVNHLVNQPEYQHLIAMLCAAYAARGHKVLLVSDRVAFLKTVARLIGDQAVCIVGEVGETDRDRLLNSLYQKDINVLCGTQAIFSEGISQDVLSCLILGTPLNNEPLLEQLIGRVIRLYPNKPTPKVVDIHLRGNTATKQASNRMAYYIKSGYKIRELK